MGYFTELLKDRVSPYEIDSELMVRKWLEKHTDYHFEFCKNDDKYGFDIICNQYKLDGKDWEKHQIGYIEVELSSKWNQFQYPGNWRSHSFLARKIYKFRNGQFINELKEGCDKMVYVIFNKPMTNCVACRPIDLLGQNPEFARVSYTGDERFDWGLRVPLDCNIVAKGQEQVSNLVDYFLKTAMI